MPLDLSQVAGFVSGILGANENLAPNFDVEVENFPIDIGVKQFIQRLEYESSDGIADMAKLSISNPNFVLTDRNIFQPGHQLSIWMGYGPKGALNHIGRVVISKVQPTYPQTGMPMIEVTGYTKDAAMMDHQPAKSKVDQATGTKNKRGSVGRAHVRKSFSKIVKDKAGEYQFDADVDDTPDNTDRIQPAGMTDYELIRGLANIVGYLFWVDGDSLGKWTLHFRNPLASALSFQDKTFSFKYNDGDFSSLLEFNPELAVRGFNTSITAVVKNTLKGKPMSVTLDEGQEAPDAKFDGDVEAVLDKPETSGAAVKLYFGDFSFDVTAGKRFKSEAEIKSWVKQWFRRQRENFVLARGKTIGLESLMARQIHNIEGVGTGLSGPYYFSNVRHIMDAAGGGYICDFNARKVVP